MDQGREPSLLTVAPLPQESQNLFCCLYRSWCHNPVTTVSLCFLTQNYRHAYDLIQKLYPLTAIQSPHPPTPHPPVGAGVALVPSSCLSFWGLGQTSLRPSAGDAVGCVQEASVISKQGPSGPPKGELDLENSVDRLSERRDGYASVPCISC